MSAYVHMNHPFKQAIYCTGTSNEMCLINIYIASRIMSLTSTNKKVIFGGFTNHSIPITMISSVAHCSSLAKEKFGHCLILHILHRAVCSSALLLIPNLYCRSITGSLFPSNNSFCISSCACKPTVGLTGRQCGLMRVDAWVSITWGQPS